MTTTAPLPTLTAAPFDGPRPTVEIGTRLSPGSRIVRGAERKLISRTYNRLVHTTLRASSTDAQCGFKAIRTDIARALLPRVADQEWFFDTAVEDLKGRWRIRHDTLSPRRPSSVRISSARTRLVGQAR